MTQTTDITTLNLEQLKQVHDEQIIYVDDDVAILETIRYFAVKEAFLTLNNFVIVCMEGEMKMDINGRTIQLHKHELYFSRSRVIIDNYSFSPDLKSKVFCVSDNMLHAMLKAKVNVWMEAAYMGTSNIFQLTPNEVALLEAYVTLIKEKLRLKVETMFQGETMHSLLQALLLEFCDLLCRLNADQQGGVPQGRVLFNKFLSLLSNMDAKRHKVKFYAEKLAVSSKYLNEVCKKYSNQTCLRWIEYYMFEEIRYYLCNTNLTIKEVSNKLGFPNVSFFGTYVKRHFGKSPMCLRKDGELKKK
ncbi:MAG: helix-turn-helix domain-containing protein [Prevotella sp.]|jgi:AraC family transcriptional activator of pobA